MDASVAPTARCGWGAYGSRSWPVRRRGSEPRPTSTISTRWSPRPPIFAPPLPERHTWSPTRSRRTAPARWCARSVAQDAAPTWSVERSWGSRWPAGSRRSRSCSTAWPRPTRSSISPSPAAPRGSEPSRWRAWRRSTGWRRSARLRGRRARIGLRVNPGLDRELLGTHDHVATGHDEAKFGIRAQRSAARLRPLPRARPPR